MIHYFNGDIFASQCQTIVNPVNCEGIMDKGLAFDFKRKYPMMFKSYVRSCELGLVPGKLHIYTKYDKKIVNFPTKEVRHTRSKISYIKQGLIKFSEIWEANGIESVAFPGLGCGYGHLPWYDVSKVMEKYLLPISEKIRVEIYLPGGFE